MSTLIENTISIQSTNSEKEEIIENDENEDENEDNKNNENKNKNNKNENENENKEEDNKNNNNNNNNNDKKEEEDNNEGETNDQKLKTSNVWNFIDKKIHKYLSCSKIFEKKTGTSSIHTHLKSYEILLIKEK